MQVTRMDLDGAGSPTALVTKILKVEPELNAPIPIETLAHQLDISEIREITTDAFEGGLITDLERSDGFILINRRARGRRRRFTVGHELGHFLMTHHRPSTDDGFHCSRADMRRWARTSDDPTIRMESEANEFSALMLMPPPLWRKETGKYRDPDLGQILALADTFDVSKEAAARTYAQYHDELVATLVVKDGKIVRLYRAPTRFPRMCIQMGQRVPASSVLFHSARRSTPSSIEEARSEDWLESNWGARLPELYEQVLFQQNGFALMMLWAETPEEEDEADDDRTAKERLRDRLANWQR